MTRARVLSILCNLLLVTGLLSPVLAFRTAGPATDNPALPDTSTLIINEYLADPAGSNPGDLSGDANGDGVRDSADDEFVEIVNTGVLALNIGMFTISDAAQTRFVFPAGKIIPPGESAVVFGGGTPTGSFGNAAANGLVFTAGSSGLSLNNGGDTITIKDSLAAVVTSLTFGSAEGSANQSITRSPDITGAFVPHSTASGSGGSLFSPGARVNQAPFTTTDPVITSLSPPGTVAGDDPVSILVNGLNFVSGSTVCVNGSPVPTTFSGSEQLTADLPLNITGSPGTCAITVRNPNGALSNEVIFTVLSQVGINEYLADPPDGQLGDSNGDGIRDSAQDEFVEIINRTDAPIAVGGFSLRDLDAQRFTFPPGTIIPAGEAAVIFGGGIPQGDFGNARNNGLVFTAALSLNNSGDTIMLKDASGLAIESVTFGSMEGNANQSLNRNPDVVGISFVTHSSAPGSGGRLFSPGTLVSGAAFTAGPRIITITPSSIGRDAPAFEMSVTGNNFEGSSEVLIDERHVDTIFSDSSHLVARVPSSVTAISGLHPVQVRNAGGNRSNSLTLTVVPPPPTVFSILPRVVIVGIGGHTMFVSGKDFDSGAQVLIDGVPLSTIITSTLELKATVPASLNASVGTRTVVVRNGDGKQSNTTTYEVIPATTVISSINPSNIIAGGHSFPLLIKGANFKSGVAAFFDSVELPLTRITQSELSAIVPDSLIATPGIHAVSVNNPNEFRSNDVLFIVLPNPPLIISVDPGTAVEKSGEMMLVLTGQRFQSGAVALIDDGHQRSVALETTFIDNEKLIVRLPAALTDKSGTLSLEVQNPDFGLSNTFPFKVLIREPLVINEYLADPPLDLSGDANGDGVRSSSADEFVELLNRTSVAMDISGYKLSDADGIRHVFPAGTVIPPFEATVVFGGGSPSGAFGNATDNRLVFKASTGGLSLNNSGDTITLQDVRGNVIQQIKFGAAEGGARQSLNRDPDSDGSTFTLHTNVSADRTRLFSPGTRASGETFTTRPVLESVSPSSVLVGSSDFTVSVSGSNFVPGAVVLFGGLELPTLFHSDSQLESQVSANMVNTGGRTDIQVRNPRGELSGLARFVITDDPPRLMQINPSKTGTGAESLELSISGERFQHAAVAMVDGVEIATKFVSSNSLIAVLPSALLTRAVELKIIVVNADSNGSNSLPFTVENGPLITRLSRGKIRSGVGVFEIEVEGVAFKPDAVLYANGVALTTTYINDGSLTATIPAAMTHAPGTLTLQARHFDGGRSNTVNLKIQ